jgi:uncharacterized protein YbaP (TraB family)
MQKASKTLAIRLLVILFVSLGFCLPALAASPVWKISKDGQSFYLAGSIHMLRQKDWPLPEAFDFAYANSDMLVVETDLAKVYDLRIMLPAMLLPRETDLRKETDPEIYRAFEKISALDGLKMEGLQRFKPVAAALTLSSGRMTKARFLRKGPDFHYFSLAQKDSRPLDYLETVEAQLDIFFSDDDPAAANEFVRETISQLNDWAKTKTQFLRLVTEWRSGELDEAEKLEAEMRTQTPRYHKRLLVNRNNAWMSKLERYLETRETEFVIVGYAHLAGRDGLLNQLRQRGCKVEQI